LVVKCIAGEDGRSTRGFMIEGFSLHRFCMTGMMQWQWLCEEWQWTFIRWTKRSHFQGSRDIRSGRWGQWSGSGCVVCECLRLIPRFRCGSGTCLVGDELKKKKNIKKNGFKDGGVMEVGTVLIGSIRDG
jgi:hypothetical protein